MCPPKNTKKMHWGNFTIPSLLTALLLALPLHARPASGYYANPEIDELRIELDDLKYALKTTQVDLNLLEERSQKQDKALFSIKGESPSKNTTSLTTQVTALEKKIS